MHRIRPAPFSSVVQTNDDSFGQIEKKNVQYILNYGPIKDLPSQNIVNYCLLALEKYDFQYPDFTSGLQCAQTYFFGHRI